MMEILPELRALCLDGITLRHLAESEDVPLATAMGWSHEERAAKREALIGKMQAFFALCEAHSVVLRHLYTLPPDTDIEHWVAAGRGPAKLRKSWQEFTESAEYRFFTDVMSDIVAASPRRAVAFMMATKGAAS